ncbi:MAG: hypothetical protein IJP68_07415 [Selenomonadaceae bacterium]|nr:hypothetical protein [Selenomonadaceae bacterium]
MKAQAELNALLLQAKNYERLQDVKIHIHRDNKVIQIVNVPGPLVDHFADKIGELIAAEVETTTSLVEKSAQAFAAATR